MQKITLYGSIVMVLGVLTALGFNFTPVFKDEFSALAEYLKSEIGRITND
jgi:hypothetical protein